MNPYADSPRSLLQVRQIYVALVAFKCVHTGASALGASVPYNQFGKPRLKTSHMQQKRNLFQEEIAQLKCSM